MLRKFFFLSAAAILVTLAWASVSEAYYAYHYSAGGGGGAHYSYHYGYGGGGGARYGYARRW